MIGRYYLNFNVNLLFSNINTPYRVKDIAFLCLNQFQIESLTHHDNRDLVLGVIIAKQVYLHA